MAALPAMIGALKSQFRQANPLSDAHIFGLSVLIFLPALLFSGLMPGWAPGAALAGLALVFLLRGLAVGRVVGPTPADIPLLALLVLLPLNVTTSINPAVTAPLALAMAANLALFWAVAAQHQSPLLGRTGWVLLLGGLAAGVVIGLGTGFSAGKLPFINREIYTALPARRLAFWDDQNFNPNLAGGLIAMFLLPALVLAVRGASWQQRDAAKVVAVLLAGLLLLTQSRGAMLAALVALAGVTLVQNRRWLWLWGALAGGILAAILWFGPTPFFDTVAANSRLSQGHSLAARVELWDRAARLVADFPLTGVGLGLIPQAVQQWHPTQLINPTADFRHAHNIYLQTAAEMGLPGLVAFGAALFGLLRGLFRRARAGGARSGLALALLGSLIVFLVHGWFDAITASPQVALVVWGLFGLMAAVIAHD